MTKRGLMIKFIFNDTAQLKVLAFLVDHAGQQYFEKEIRDATKLSAGTTNKVLRELSVLDYVLREKKGRMSFYRADLGSPVVRQFKILLAIVSLNPLLQKLKSMCKKVVLFGSLAQGTNTEESDIDLFVMTNVTEAAENAVAKSGLAQKVQLIVKTPVELATIKKNDPVFYDEIERGIVLWEEK
jgi:predicted nucleotidyltransferase